MTMWVRPRCDCGIPMFILTISSTLLLYIARLSLNYSQSMDNYT